MIRSCMLVAVFLFTVGAVAMPNAVAQGKRTQGEKKKKEKESKFNEKVTLRAWDKQRKQFLKPQENIDAYRQEIPKKGLVIVLGGREVTPITGHPTIGSEITDKDSKVYVVSRVEGKRPYFCYVTEKVKQD